MKVLMHALAARSFEELRGASSEDWKSALMLVSSRKLGWLALGSKGHS
jgi:hypothetical protein